MKKVLLYLVACFATMQVVAQNGNDSIFVANELYVKLKINQPQNLIQYIPHPDNPSVVKQIWGIIQAHSGISMVNPFKGNLNSTKNLYKVKLKAGGDIEGLIKELNQHPNIEYAERIPIYYIQFKPVELDEEKQWYFRTINMDASWSSPSPNEKVVAIIDNGVRYTHEDLFARIAWNIDPFDPDKSEIPNDGIDNDGNGYVDDYYGWDFGDNDNDPAPIPRPIGLDLNSLPQFGWHGTHVAGIVAAADNQRGIASLGVSNRIVCIKAASNRADDKGRVNDLAIINVVQAFEYAVDRKVDVINCSFATSLYNQSLQDVITEARKLGIIVVASAGNVSAKDKKPEVLYPAAYKGVISVGATDRDDHVADFSNYGSLIDVMAPGVNIYSTVASGDQDYAYMSGTSMAAPIVSSLIGLILSKEPSKVNDIENILKGGCDNIDWKNPSYTGKLGAGRINVDKSFYYIEYETSVSEVHYNDIQVYPNPASNEVFIPFENLAPNGELVKVTIFNNIGAEVAVQEISNNQQAVSVAGLPQGIYQITLTSSQGQNYRSRLLVNR